MKEFFNWLFGIKSDPVRLKDLQLTSFEIEYDIKTSKP